MPPAEQNASGQAHMGSFTMALRAFYDRTMFLNLSNNNLTFEVPKTNMSSCTHTCQLLDHSKLPKGTKYKKHKAQVDILTSNMQRLVLPPLLGTSCKVSFSPRLFWNLTCIPLCNASPNTGTTPPKGFPQHCTSLLWTVTQWDLLAKPTCKLHCAIIILPYHTLS